MSKTSFKKLINYFCFKQEEINLKSFDNIY